MTRTAQSKALVIKFISPTSIPRHEVSAMPMVHVRSMLALLLFCLMLKASPVPRPDGSLVNLVMDVSAVANLNLANADLAESAKPWNGKPNGGAFTFPEIMVIPVNKLPF